MDRTRLVADKRFSSHQAGVMQHMGLRSLNVTYPTSSADEKGRTQNILVIKTVEPRFNEVPKAGMENIVRYTRDFVK